MFGGFYIVFDSMQFKVESSISALSIKQQVISQNIANKETLITNRKMHHS